MGPSFPDRRGSLDQALDQLVGTDAPVGFGRSSISDLAHCAFVATVGSACWGALKFGASALVELHQHLVVGRGIREARLCVAAYSEFAIDAQGRYATGALSFEDAKLAAQFAVTATESMRLEGAEKVQALVALARSIPLVRAEVAERALEWARHESKPSLDILVPLMRLGTEFRRQVLGFAREFASAQPAVGPECEALTDAASTMSTSIQIPLARSERAQGIVLGEGEYAAEVDEPGADDRIEEIVRVNVVEWLEERGDLRFMTRLVERASELRPVATWRGLRQATDDRPQRQETADLVASVQRRRPGCSTEESAPWKHRGLESPLPPPGETAERVWTFDTGPAAGTITIGRPRVSSPRRLLSLRQ